MNTDRLQLSFLVPSLVTPAVAARNRRQDRPAATHRGRLGARGRDTVTADSGAVADLVLLQDLNFIGWGAVEVGWIESQRYISVGMLPSIDYIGKRMETFD